jgi:hypothetical protein
MKSKERLDREILAVADAWNSGEDDRDPSSTRNQVASAIYHTLCWARGRRESLPEVKVRKLFPRTPPKAS